MARTRRTKSETPEALVGESQGVSPVPQATGTSEVDSNSPDVNRLVAKPYDPEEAVKREILPATKIGGQYRLKATIRLDGKLQQPGTVVRLSDANARHYLTVAPGSIEAVE